jgi:hypothetical protein
MAYPVAPIQFKKDDNNVNLTITLKNNENSGPFAFTFTGTSPLCVIGFFIKPIYKVEKATLFINTSGLTTTETNLGVINIAQTQFTLNNVNMRQLCRSMWDKYKKFNIFLTGTTSNSGAVVGVNASYILQMEGFNFINQTAYITGTGQTQTATLGTISIGNVAATPRSNGYQNGIVTSFYKDQDFVNLTLRALPIAPGTPISNFVIVCGYTFTIVGIPDDE